MEATVPGKRLIEALLNPNVRPETVDDYVMLATDLVFDLMPGGTAIKLLKGTAGKVLKKQLGKQLIKEVRKANKAAKKVRQHKKLAAKASKERKNTVMQAGNYHPAPRRPEDMPAFSGLKKVTRKTSKGGGKLRERWEDEKGNIYEWDSQHGTFEKYNKRGHHLGEFNKDTGVQTKPANLTRKIEP